MANVTLANYLGTGSNPNLTLVLSENGPRWSPYKINYKGIGNIPWSSNPSEQWSSWNVVDDNKKYYGTITLNCNGTTASWVSYTPGREGYYLEKILFSPVPNQASAYQLTVEKITQPSPPSPFPNAPLATPAEYPGTNRRIWLRTKDGKIVNDQGKVVVLKGLARPSLEWNRQGQYLSQSDIAAMRKWGANVIRIALNQAFWLDSGPRESMGSYKQIVDAMIYYAIKLEMAVILDLHIIRPTTPVQQDNMANVASIRFWQDIAKTYADFGTVLFELYNEPNAITNEQWLNGGDNPRPPTGQGPYVGYQQLYNAVREAGAKNICIVAGTRFGYDLSFVNSGFRVQGVDIVYCAHPWQPRGTAEDPLDRNFAGLRGEFPVIFTEFGWNGWGKYNADFYKYLISYMNEHGFHYTGWGWWVEANNPAFPCLIDDWTGTPINGGKIIHDDIQRNPGTPMGPV